MWLKENNQTNETPTVTVKRTYEADHHRDDCIECKHVMPTGEWRVSVGNLDGVNLKRSNINSYGNESLWHRQDSIHGFVPLGQSCLLALLTLFIQPILTSTFDMGRFDRWRRFSVLDDTSFWQILETYHEVDKSQPNPMVLKKYVYSPPNPSMKVRAHGKVILRRLTGAPHQSSHFYPVQVSNRG